MSDNDWSAELQRVHREQAAQFVVSPADLTVAMATLWSLLQRCPDELSTAYREIPEAELAAIAARFQDDLDCGRIGWSLCDDIRALALEMGGQLRALDTELTTRPNFAAAPTRMASLLCEPVDAFVIPRRTPKPLGGLVGPGKGFRRRGTPHHRILPAQVGDYRIEPVWEPRLSTGNLMAASHQLGAALMPGLELDWVKEDAGWIATAAPCEDDAALVAQQVTAGFQQPLLAMVWPELAMPPERLELVQAALRECSIPQRGLSGPAIVASGSWHETHEGEVQNVMHILDKTGRKRMKYVKRLRYVRGDVVEGVPGTRSLPILINNDALVAFAICLDFCEQELPRLPYHDLDIDLVLVASRGNATTMKGHEGNAGMLRNRQGARTFVVQQAEPPEKGTGFVFPAEADEQPLREDRAWSVRSISFSPN